MKKVLIIHTRELCYFSGSFFLEQIARQLEQHGVIVEQLELSTEDASYDLLQSYMEKQYDGVVDINSKLPYLTVDEKGGEFWLDQLEAPFYNYILDHPLYHHRGLSFPLQNYHAIGVDMNHCNYMRQHYPHLQEVTYLPVAGTQSVISHPIDQRRIPLLFSGTYESEEAILKQLQEQGAEIERLGKSAVSLIMQENVTLEFAIQELLSTGEYHPLEEMDFALLMNQLYPVDKYIRNYQRRTILEGLAKDKIPITVMGEGWNQTRLNEEPYITLLSGKKYARGVEMVADSKILLDINPLFHSGVHDRVTNALANRTLCVTNMSQEIEKELQNKKEIYYYQQDNVQQLAEVLNQAMKCDMEEATNRAYGIYQKKYTWEAHAKTLLRMMKDFKDKE